MLPERLIQRIRYVNHFRRCHRFHHYKGFEGQWNENVRLWYNLLIIIQYTKVPFQGPFRML